MMGSAWVNYYTRSTVCWNWCWEVSSIWSEHCGSSWTRCFGTRCIYNFSCRVDLLGSTRNTSWCRKIFCMSIFWVILRIPYLWLWSHWRSVRCVVFHYLCCFCSQCSDIGGCTPDRWRSISSIISNIWSCGSCKTSPNLTCLLFRPESFFYF